MTILVGQNSAPGQFFFFCSPGRKLHVQGRPDSLERVTNKSVQVTFTNGSKLIEVHELRVLCRLKYCLPTITSSNCFYQIWRCQHFGLMMYGQQDLFHWTRRQEPLFVAHLDTLLLWSPGYWMGWIYLEIHCGRGEAFLLTSIKPFLCHVQAPWDIESPPPTQGWHNRRPCYLLLRVGGTIKGQKWKNSSKIF